MATNEFLEKIGFRTRFEPVDKSKPENVKDYLYTLEQKYAVTREEETEDNKDE